MLLRAEFLPKPLAIFAVIATVLQLIAVGHTLFQQSIPNLIQAPLAITQLIVPIYLSIFGFKKLRSPNTDQVQVAS